MAVLYFEMQVSKRDALTVWRELQLMVYQHCGLIPVLARGVPKPGGKRFDNNQGNE